MPAKPEKPSRTVKSAASTSGANQAKPAGKKRAASESRTANKTQPMKLSPKKFLASVEHPVRQAEGLLLLDWFTATTGLPAVMWGPSIIGYGRYHYQYASGRSGDYCMTGFSPRKSALSIYILPGYRDMSEYLEKLGKHKIGKSCLYINKLSDIDLDVLGDMVLDGLQYMRYNYETWDR